METDLSNKLEYENNRNNNLNQVIDSKNNDINILSNERAKVISDYQNEHAQKIVLEDNNQKLNKELEFESIKYNNLSIDFTNTKNTLYRSIDDLNIKLSDVQNRRNILENDNIVLTHELKKTKDDLDSEIIIKNNIIESNTITINGLNDRINQLTGDNIDLRSHNNHLGTDLKATRTTVDVLNCRVDTLNRIGYPYPS